MAVGKRRARRYGALVPSEVRRSAVRQNVEFDAEGVTLRGWLYVPDGAGAPAPTVVMAHGLSAVKEMYLDRFAEVFADAGLAALVFDNRNFGESDGEPRQEIDPWAQVRDYRHAITYAATRPKVDGAGSASGARAIPAVMCWWSARSTAACAASPPRCP